MRRELLALEPGLVIMDASTMETHMAASLMPARVGAMLATAFGGLGTLLAAIGLYGVIAFSVARRTKEIGLRMALGAEPGGVLAMVMRQGFTLVAVGLVVGALLAAGAATVLQGLLYGITPFDPWAWSCRHRRDGRPPARSPMRCRRAGRCASSRSRRCAPTRHRRTSSPRAVQNGTAPAAPSE